MRVVLDTDVSSGLIKRNLPTGLAPKIVGHELAVTFVTIGELTKWVFRRELGRRRRTEIDAWIARRPRIPATTEVARKWGEIVAYAEKRGRPRPVNDSWIAACCLVYDLPLATLNLPDFADYVEYEGLTVIAAD